MKRRCGIAFHGLLWATSATAQTTVQIELEDLLNQASASDIARFRSACALGQMADANATIRKAGLNTADVGAYCTTVLTRAGRDGTLGYVRDPQNRSVTPAIAFDAGFVAAYLKRDPVPANAPAMAALMPIADRCLSQGEPKLELCTAVGQIIGARAARGETLL